MTVKIETTVGKAAAALKKCGADCDRRVTVIVWEPGDEEKLADLRSAVAEGDASGELMDGDQIFAELKAELKQTFPKNYSN